MFIWILEYFNFEYSPFRLFPVHKLTPGPHTLPITSLYSFAWPLSQTLFHSLCWTFFVQLYACNSEPSSSIFTKIVCATNSAQSGRLYDRMKRVSNIKLPFVAVNFRSLYVGSMLSLFYCLIAASIFSFNILLHFQFGLLFPISLCSI